MENTDFTCIHCLTIVPITETMGTKNRNHCPSCLWSKHVDDKIPGDRKSVCHKPMQPIGFTFKNAGIDRYGKKKQGELMVIHHCETCKKYSINRVAADDSPETILSVFEQSLAISEKKKEILLKGGITMCEEKDRKDLTIQLYGNKLS